MTSSEELALRIRQNLDSSTPVLTSLATNQRVIARVTDGIYREPGSAIRELISNAYDADATYVTVKTDAPQFRQITVEDDGRGMTPESLAHLLKNIGGSAKRTDLGQELGISLEDDPDRSPSGRKLIGKLGIGIFSVSQLTRGFQIVTKVEGDDFRSVAQVKLKQFSDANAANDGDEEFDAGSVAVWRERTSDTDQHGTSIILTSIRQQTRESLRSSEIWDAIDNVDPDEVDIEENGERRLSFVPRFHIGRSDASLNYLQEGTGSQRKVPWSDDSNPREAFDAMVNSVWTVAAASDPNPKLEGLFDNYLQMVWTLSLALPVDYYQGHLFDEAASSDWADFFRLSNKPKGHASLLEPGSGQLVRDLIGLRDSAQGATPFRVFVDELEIRRPIRFRDLPMTTHALRKPIVFLGKMRQEFSSISADVSTGPLDFEAYFYWTPKVAPVDHRGALVRIHGASGALFDHSFFRYQVSEQTRLRQITCEIFVREGLESALNIDREAFNTAHPHMVVLIKWVHSALRQLATAQKGMARAVRSASNAAQASEKLDDLAKIVQSANLRQTAGEGIVPGVRFVAGASSRAEQDQSQEQDPANFTYTFDQSVLSKARDPKPRATVDLHAQKVGSIVQVLSIYGLLDQLTASDQQELISALSEIVAQGND